MEKLRRINIRVPSIEIYSSYLGKNKIFEINLNRIGGENSDIYYEWFAEKEYNGCVERMYCENGKTPTNEYLKELLSDGYKLSNNYYEILTQ